MSFEIIKPDINFDFIGKRYLAFGFSILLILVCVISVVSKGGLRLGIDFEGGLSMQVRFLDLKVDADSIRKTLEAAPNLPSTTIQAVNIDDKANNDYFISVQLAEGGGDSAVSQAVATVLKTAYGDGQIQVRQVDMVGPKVGQDLRQKALYALFYSVLMSLIYISGRFEKKWGISAIFVGALLLAVYLAGLLGMAIGQLIIVSLVVTLILCYVFKFEYALGAILALVHDVIITVGVFSVLDKEITLSFVAAILTIVGYSLNDSIIIYDRIREHLRIDKRGDYATLINTSINKTLSRTVLTSGSTLFVVACLYFFGSQGTKDFALALLVGIGFGTFSSIFISAPALLFWQKKKLASEPRV